MNGLLVSVATVAEARLALAAGIDILDMKDPQTEALGRLPDSILRDIVTEMRGAVTTSATIGDLPMDARQLSDAVLEVAATGVDFVKIGFFGHEHHAECAQAIAATNYGKVRLIAVLMADDSPDFTLLPMLQAAGFTGVMLDTAGKQSKNLLDCLSLEELDRFCRIAGDCGLLTGLAGSLQSAHIAALSGLAVNYLGFRGAVCEKHDRRNALELSRLMTIRAMLREYNK